MLVYKGTTFFENGSKFRCENKPLNCLSETGVAEKLLFRVELIADVVGLIEVMSIGVVVG